MVFYSIFEIKTTESNFKNFIVATFRFDVHESFVFFCLPINDTCIRVKIDGKREKTVFPNRYCDQCMRVSTLSKSFTSFIFSVLRACSFDILKRKNIRTIDTGTADFRYFSIFFLHLNLTSITFIFIVMIVIESRLLLTT